VSAVLLALRLVVAAVFAVAAVGKLADRRAFVRALHDFGVVSRVEVVAVALPISELAVALLLVPATTARVGAVAAVALLVVFCAVIARVLLRGEHPDCGCFGNVYSARVGARTLVRNVALGAGAAAVAAIGPGHAVAVHVPLLDAIVLGGLAFNLWFGWQLLRQNGRLLERVRALDEAKQPAGLPVGATAPQLDLDDVAAGVPLALVFSDPSCPACAELEPRIARLRRERAGRLEIAVVTGDPAAVEAYRIRAVPSATIVDPHGRIASETAAGVDAVEQLLEAVG
jgi:uncharacterized membrane protein YphA (DoxX/SURF4 family)